MYKKRSALGTLRKDIQDHMLEYTLLLVSAGLYLTFLAIFKAQPTKQFIVTALFILYYIGWGIIHHVRDQSLHLKVVLEYIAIGAIVGLLMRGLLG